MTTTFKWMALGAVLGFFAATGVSCGPAKCTPSNCAFGCCDATGSCQTGVSDSQCGGAGRTCSACVLGQTCQLGICVSSGSGGGFGGGSQGGGSGGGAQGGGTGGGTTGGGTGGGTTGGGTGGGTTGGGTGGGTSNNGGGTGGGTTGGGTGGGTTGGGSGSGCTALGAAYTTFMAGRSTCPSSNVTLLASPSLASQCTSSCSAGNDPAAISSLAACLTDSPACTSGNELGAQGAFNSCATPVLAGLSSQCQSMLASLASAPTGGGGGTTGGGGGTTGGGGGTTTCTTISTFMPLRVGGSYDTTNDVTVGNAANTSTDPTDILTLQLWNSSTATFPVTRQLSTATYQTCISCAILSRGCTTGTGGTCSGGDYLARTGSMTVTAAGTTTGSTFAASISSVRFDEWDLTTDMAVPNGRCVNVTSGSLSVTLP